MQNRIRIMQKCDGKMPKACKTGSGSCKNVMEKCPKHAKQDQDPAKPDQDPAKICWKK